MKRLSFKPLKIILINLLILSVLLELASVGFYYYQTKKFFYLRPKGQQVNSTATTGQDAGDAYGSILHRLHPYLGFVYDQQVTKNLLFSQVSYKANNFGIMSPYQYPYKKTGDDQFIVGVFGGSVAMFAGFYELENHVLADALKRLPALQNKQIVVLPFALGAHKQPQQLIALNYLLSLGQEFDMVINIDGFNETALANLNNKSSLAVSMPNVEILGPMVQLANKNLSLSDLALSLEILKMRAELREREAAIDKCRIAVCYSFQWLQLRRTSSEYQKKLEAFNAISQNEHGGESLVHLNKTDKPLDDGEEYRQIADVWANSTIAMSQLLSQKHIPYFEVIQPNQYYATARKFSDEERSIAVDPSNRYAEGVSKGYPGLLARVGDLQKAGVNVINAVNAFDSSPEIVYEDTCCHYNRVGNQLFANFLAGQVVGILTAQPAPLEH